MADKSIEEQVFEALERVIHPSFGLSLVMLQMVRAVRVTDFGVEIDLVMNCPGCPASEAALVRLRQALQPLFDSSKVQLKLLHEVWRPPWEKNETKGWF